jgi:hypothetical protein
MFGDKLKGEHPWELFCFNIGPLSHEMDAQWAACVWWWASLPYTIWYHVIYMFSYQIHHMNLPKFIIIDMVVGNVYKTKFIVI